VFEHKTCAINFFGDTYGRAFTYVQVFGEAYLGGGFMFPHVSVTTNSPTSRKMTPSSANVAVKRVWSEFQETADDRDELPEHISSRFIRHCFVTQVHSDGGHEAIQEAAYHMPHAVKTAKQRYDASLGYGKTVHTSRRFRQYLAGAFRHSLRSGFERSCFIVSTLWLHLFPSFA
jgi:hypothetical protein